MSSWLHNEAFPYKKQSKFQGLLAELSETVQTMFSDEDLHNSISLSVCGVCCKHREETDLVIQDTAIQLGMESLSLNSYFYYESLDYVYLTSDGFLIPRIGQD